MWAWKRPSCRNRNSTESGQKCFQFKQFKGTYPSNNWNDTKFPLLNCWIDWGLSSIFWEFSDVDLSFDFISLFRVKPILSYFASFLGQGFSLFVQSGATHNTNKFITSAGVRVFPPQLQWPRSQANPEVCRCMLLPIAAATHTQINVTYLARFH